MTGFAEKLFSTQASRLPFATRSVLTVAIAYLALAWLAVLLVDIFNVLNLQTRLVTTDHPRPLLWFFLFQERGPTELLQWSMLCVALWATLSMRRISHCFYSTSLATAFSIFSAGLALMLIEDAANFRHVLGSEVLFPGHEEKHPFRIAWELGFYFCLALLMISPFVILLLNKFKFPIKPTMLLLLGYGCYGIAAFASASRNIGDWYLHSGNWIIAKFGLQNLPAWSISISNDHIWATAYPDFVVYTGFLIMDLILEESLELLAATLLAAGLLALRTELVEGDTPEIGSSET